MSEMQRDGSEMRCKRCGANESRIHGFCSVECEHYFDYEEEITDLNARIAELEEAQRWIPVGEKPKIGQYCAVIQLDKYGQFIEGGYAIYYGESSEYAMEVWKNITHWYPVPNWNAIKMPEEIQ